MWDVRCRPAWAAVVILVPVFWVLYFGGIGAGLWGATVWVHALGLLWCLIELLAISRDFCLGCFGVMARCWYRSEGTRMQCKAGLFDVGIQGVAVWCSWHRSGSRVRLLGRRVSVLDSGAELGRWRSGPRVGPAGVRLDLEPGVSNWAKRAVWMARTCYTGSRVRALVVGRYCW